MTDTIEQLHRLWEDAAMTALENSRRASGTAQQKNTAEKGGEVKQSQRLGGYYPDIKVSTKDISIFGIKDINDLKEVKYRVYNYLLGKYVSNDKISKPIKNIDTGMDIYIYKGGIDETFGNTNAYKNLYTKNKKVKLATMTSLAKLIKYGEVRSPEASNLHNPKSKNTYAYLTAPIVVDGITYTVNMDIKKTQMGNRFYVHTIKIAGDSPKSDNSQTKYSNHLHNEVDQILPRTNSASGIKKSTSKSSIRNPESNVKQKQLEIIQQTNPMWDDYHTGIRTVADIHTWAEVLELNDEREGQFVWGDFSRADAEQALKDGTITVYSSYPIKNGVFVSTSYIQAQEYAGGRNGKVYSKTIPLTDVAWINGDEGQYAEIGEAQKYTAESGGVKYSDRDIKNDYSYENLNSSDYYTNDKIYSYKFLTAQKDMTVVNVPNIDNIFTNKKIDRAKIVATGKENAKNTNGSIVDEKDSVFVTNVYTKKRYRIDNQSIKHGLGGDKSYLITNSRLGMVIGDIVKNAIPINALKNKTSDVEGTFAMVSYGVSEAQKEFISIVTIEIRTGDVKSVETIESVHSVSGRIKKGSHVGNKPQGDRHMSNPFTTSTISISQLLEIVNSSHQSILSDDVLNHFGKPRNSNGTYSNDVLFSDRDPEAVKQYEQINRQLEKENQKLREDVSDLKELVRLQRTLTHGKMFTKSSLDIVAKRIINYAGAKGNTAELADGIKV